MARRGRTPPTSNTVAGDASDRAKAKEAAETHGPAKPAPTKSASDALDPAAARRVYATGDGHAADAAKAADAAQAADAAPYPNAEFRAILFILAGMFAISVNDATIKFLSGDYPLHQMVFIRSAIGLIFSFAFLRLEGGLHLLRTSHPALHALRASLIVIANMLFFSGLAILPLADNTALFFIAPLVITLLGVPVLGERFGPRRLAAILVGFLGVLVMVGPGASASAEADTPPVWALALPLLAAICYAGMQVLTRKLGVTSRASAMAIYIQSMFLLVSACFFVAVGDGRLAADVENPALVFLLRAWTWPTADDWPLFLLMGLMGGGIGYLLSSAYRLGRASTIASYEYVALPLAVFWGWSIWGEVPSPRTMLGIALIVGAGLYVFLRERQRSEPLASARPQRRL
ncbi:MAG: DMT family transporter [Pseudomonadota bacterium]